MFKYLLLIAVVGLVVWFYRRTTGPVARSSGRTAAPSPVPVESMTACAHCQVRFPRSEALYEADQTYCCEAHRRLGKR